MTLLSPSCVICWRAVHLHRPGQSFPLAVIRGPGWAAHLSVMKTAASPTDTGRRSSALTAPIQHRERDRCSISSFKYNHS